MSDYSSMSDEFLDWLQECPVTWHQMKDDRKGNSEYMFITGAEK